MKKPTQRDTNPYPYSDSNKRYLTFDYYMRRRFGSKCARISLDAGFSCPNIDGRCGTGGCIYCLGGSSGACAGKTLEEQYAAGTAAVRHKWQTEKFIPYLQAHTNTYAAPERLRKIYGEAAALPGAVMLAIATRADCLDSATVEILAETSQKIPLLVELGLQTVHDETAELIGRGHGFSEFVEGYNRLREAGGDITICFHLINGLPGESFDMMLENMKSTASLGADMVKIHLLHVLRGTRLEEMWRRGEYVPMDMEEYAKTVVRQLEVLRGDTVIARVGGDAPNDVLLAPDWCRRKTAVSNLIDRMLYENGTYEGRLYNKHE